MMMMMMIGWFDGGELEVGGRAVSGERPRLVEGERCAFRIGVFGRSLFGLGLDDVECWKMMMLMMVIISSMSTK